jgi:hypothetical protein
VTSTREELRPWFLAGQRLGRREASTKPSSIECPRCRAVVRVQFRPGPPPIYCSETCRRRAARARAQARRRAGIPPAPTPTATGRKVHGHGWRKLRRSVLAEHPTCQRPGCVREATDVDHIVRRRTLVELGVVDPDAPHRLTALCRYCHAFATNAFDGGYGNRLDPAGKLRWLGLDETSIG